MSLVALSKSHSGPVQSAVGGGNRDLKYIRCFIRRKIKHISQDQNRPLARRQFPEAQLQGFKSAGERNDYPYFEEQWLRYEGYGALNRVGVVVYLIGAGSYSVPTNYTVLMP